MVEDLSKFFDFLINLLIAACVTGALLMIALTGWQMWRIFSSGGGCA